MEKTLIATGKTIDLAVEAALAQLSLTRDDVSVQVLQQAKAGFLGFGAQPAKVNMTDGEIAQKVQQLFDLRPKAIEERLKLRNPIYSETASYGHVGRIPQTVKKVFNSRYLDTKVVEVELFTWEKLDYVEKVKEAFSL